MDILDRITSLLGEREQKELTEYLGLKSVAFSEWKSGKSKSYRKYLIEIAEFFGVSIDYLVYGKENAPSIQPSVIEFTNGREKEILRLFRLLPDEDQARLIGRAELLVEQAMCEENAG